MKKLDDAVLEALAEVICGSGETYRKGWEIGRFLRGVDPRFPEHDGSTRFWWTLGQLQRCNVDNPELSGVPSLEHVILRLADPREYKTDMQKSEAVRAELNKILLLEGLEVVMEGTRPKIREVDVMRLHHMINTMPGTPIEIQNSLALFREDHPDPRKVSFVMMKFSGTKAHQDIVKIIDDTLASHGISAVRADDKQYHDDLFPNIMTYMYGCATGIAVFERIEADTFNPNVSLEVGYMFALGKLVCLLKDKTLATLQSDLIGKLYNPFDYQDISTTVSKELSKWLSDRGLA